MNMNRSPRKPELHAPAGDMEKLKMAVLYGADAVYLAGTSFGMRSFAGNFTPEELPQAVSYAHSHGVKVHATVNTMARNDEVERLPPRPALWKCRMECKSPPQPHCEGSVPPHPSANAASFPFGEAWGAAESSPFHASDLR